MKDNKNIFYNDRDDCDNYINFVLKTNLILSLICESDRMRNRKKRVRQQGSFSPTELETLISLNILPFLFLFV